jgi:hypothetical protein
MTTKRRKRTTTPKAKPNKSGQWTQIAVAVIALLEAVRHLN